jgi:hypothetical protein
MKFISNLQNPTDLSKISKASHLLHVNPMMDDSNIRTQINNKPLPPDHGIAMGLGGEVGVSQSVTYWHIFKYGKTASPWQQS